MFGSAQKVPSLVFIGTLTIFFSFHVTSLPLVSAPPPRHLGDISQTNIEETKRGNISTESIATQKGTKPQNSDIRKHILIGEELAQEIVMNSLRRRTMGRIQSPCAGVVEQFTHDVGSSLYVAIVTADVLKTLTEEIQEAVSSTSAILKMYAERGLTDEVIPKRIQIFSYRLPQELTVATGMSQPHQTLTAIYRELSRAVLVLELIISSEGWPALTNGMEALKERQLFNILCGMKVVIGGRMAHNDVEDIGDTSLPRFDNTALRYVRDYVSISEIYALLTDSVALLNITSAQL